MLEPMTTGPEPKPEFSFKKAGLNLAYFVISVLILMSVSIYNKFPLLYPDSGTYLDRTMSLVPSPDKAIGYTLFIKCVTWQTTSWLVVIFQNIIINYLIFSVLKLFFQNKLLYFVHFITIIILSFFSSLPWFSNLIMPDIFTSATILIFILFVLQQNISRINYLLYSVFLFISIISHLSNLFILLILLVIFLTIYAFHFRKMFKFTLNITRVVIITGVFFTSWIFISLYNYSHNFGFRTSLCSNVLLTAKFNNTGLLKIYLDKECISGNENALCEFKDSLPESSDKFLWGDKSPLYFYKEPKGTEGWLQADSLYKPIIRDIFTSPQYYSKILSDILYYTSLQLVSVKPGTGKIAFGEFSAPYYAYREKFRCDLAGFFVSRQNNNQIPFKIIDSINLLFLFLSVVIIMTGLLILKNNHKFILFILIAVAGLVANALLTSSLSVVEDRYQSRIIWLLPLSAIILAAQMVNRKKETKC